jgi:gas vesicle protein
MGGEGNTFFDGLLAGGLLGVGLGVIFAPMTGEKMREEIKKKMKELDLDEIVDKFSKAFEAAKNEAEAKKKELIEGDN